MFGVWARISPRFEAVPRRGVLLGPLGDSPTETSGGGGAVSAVNAWWDVVEMVSPRQIGGGGALNRAASPRRSWCRSRGVTVRLYTQWSGSVRCLRCSAIVSELGPDATHARRPARTASKSPRRERELRTSRSRASQIVGSRAPRVKPRIPTRSLTPTARRRAMGRYKLLKCSRKQGLHRREPRRARWVVGAFNCEVILVATQRSDPDLPGSKVHIDTWGVINCPVFMSRACGP